MALELRQLSKIEAAGVHLDEVSLSLAPGSFNVLLGPANAGKTSILRMLAGLDQPSSGSVYLHDRDITRLAVRDRDVAFVYQEFVNYPTLTVFENIASPMRVQKRPKQEVSANVEYLAAILGLADLLERRPPSLSGGQQQRVAIARALAKDAEVILLDEPLANLDFKLREELRRELPRLFEGSDKIVVYATTDPNEAFLLGGNTVVLDKGTISQIGTAQSIFSDPHNIVATEALSEFPLNRLHTLVADNVFDVSGQLSFPAPAHLKSLPDGSYTLGFRAEHLHLEPIAAASAHYDATVTVTEITGNETIVHSRFAGESCVAVVDGNCEIAAENRVAMYLDLDELFAFDVHGRTLASPGHAYSAPGKS